VKPGETKSWTTSFKTDLASLTGTTQIALNFQADQGQVPDPVSIDLKIESIPRPRFALSYVFDDQRFGNGDGLLQMGEQAELDVTIRNEGQGVARSILGIIKNHEDDRTRKVYIERGRIEGGELGPGEDTHLRFRFKVKAPGDVPIRLVIIDPETRESNAGVIRLAVVDENRRLQPQEVSFVSRVPILRAFAHYTQNAPAKALLKGGQLGREGMPGWYRITLVDGSYGWVRRAETKPGKSEPSSREMIKPLGPMRIMLREESFEDSLGSTMELKGRVLGPPHVRDLRVFVNGKKVFFKPTSDLGQRQLDFKMTLELRLGVNRIDLVARSQNDYTRTRTFLVRRLGD
jgi:hypothetical protein